MKTPFPVYKLHPTRSNNPALMKAKLDGAHRDMLNGKNSYESGVVKMAAPAGIPALPVNGMKRK